MFNDALLIFQKEFRNVFKDKRAIFANYVVPLIIMPVLFLGLGFVTEQQSTSAQERVYPLAISGQTPSGFFDVLDSYLRYDRQSTTGDPVNRDILYLSFEPGTLEVRLAYDSTSTAQTYAAGQIRQALEEYNRGLGAQTLARAGLSFRDLENYQVQISDTAPLEAQGSTMLATLLPYLLLIYLFAGAMGMGLAITAGEKERGGLSLLLVNQMSRTSIALGKVLFLILSAMVTSASSATGIIVAIQLSPALFGSGGAGLGAGSALLTFGGIFSFFLTLLTTGGVSAALIILLGSLSKNMKEASGYVSPVYILVIFVGVITMNLDAQDTLGFFFLPLANLVFMLKGIITSQYTALQLVATLGTNLVVIGLLVLGIAKLYNSERIMNG